MKTKQLPKDWKEVEFLDCLEKEASNNKLKIQGKNFLEEGKYPIIDQGEGFIAGYTNDESKIYSEKLPVVIFGDHTRIFKFINFAFALGADGVKILVPKKNIDAKYLYYVLRNLYLPSAGYSRHYKFLKSKKILLAPLQTQKKIVQILKQAEQLKQRREQSDKLTNEYLKSVFNEMFLKEKFEEVELGEIAKLTMGGTPLTTKKEYWENGEINWMKSGNIKGDFIFSIPNKITRLGFEKSNTTLYPKDTVVIALNGQGKTRGTTAILKVETTSNQSIVGIMINKNKILSEYLHYNLKMRYNELRNITGDNSRSGLNLTILRKLEIPLPPLSLQKKFASIVEKVEKIKQYQKQSKQEINNLFNVLMQKAFRGGLVK